MKKYKLIKILFTKIWYVWRWFCNIENPRWYINVQYVCEEEKMSKNGGKCWRHHVSLHYWSLSFHLSPPVVINGCRKSDNYVEYWSLLWICVQEKRLTADSSTSISVLANSIKYKNKTLSIISTQYAVTITP